MTTDINRRVLPGFGLSLGWTVFYLSLVVLLPLTAGLVRATDLSLAEFRAAFQHYALFRHMTVFDNVAFGLRVKPRKQRPSEAVISKKVHELLNLVQLDWLADRLDRKSVV